MISNLDCLIKIKKGNLIFITKLIQPQYSYYIMTHRRYMPLPAPLKPQQQRASKPNEARLKNIYEAQLVFKDTRDKSQSFKKSKGKRQQQQHPKSKPPLQQLNLAQLKPSHRYRQSQKQPKGDSFHLYISNDHERSKNRYSKQPVALTSRNRDELSTDRGDMFKIRRKSISGSLKKKLKQQQTAQYVSANPVMPVQLNYYEQARKLYKDGKTSQALRLFQLTLEKHPDMPEAHYYTALCHLSKHSYDKAYEHLLMIIQKFGKWNKKTVYIFAAIAAKHLDKVEKSLELVSEGLEKYPDYSDLYLYRAKLFEQNKQYQKSIEDYQHVLKTKKDNAQIWLNYSLCLKQLNRTSNCLSALNTALYCNNANNHKSSILIERIKIYYHDKKIKECKKDLNKLQEIDGENCQLFYYKGLVQMKQINKKGALLSFQRCIRVNGCEEAVTGSLVQIAKSKIEDRDFYSAYYHINRAQHLRITSQDIHKFKLFTQGVVFLMKRKINEGVQNLNLLKQQYTLGDYFNKLFYLYRAFGYFMQSKHAFAIQDYKMAIKYIPKDRNVSFNQLIAQGIVMVNQSKYQSALKKFDEAQSVISSGGGSEKIQPYIYRAMTFAQKTKQNNTKDQLQTLQEIFIALKQLDKAHDINDNSSNMLYLRSLIYMHLGKTDDGLQDIIKAISKSEENVSKYFFYRALAHQTLGNTKQALNDFNICINLDQKLSLAYLQRSKLLFYNDQISKGLQDLKKYKQLQPQTDSKIHQCSLYYLSNQYDLACNCLEHIQNEIKRKQLQKWIFFKQLRITEAKQQMNAPADIMICEIMLGRWSVDDALVDELKFFSRMEYFCYMGIKYFNLESYEEAISQFSLALKQKTLMDLEDSPQNATEEEEAPDNYDVLNAPIDIQTKGNEIHYINYNLFISHLANKQYKKAKQIFIRDLLPAKDYFLNSEAVTTLSKLIFQAINFKQKQVVDVKDKEVFQFCLFRSMLGQSSDQIDIELPNFILRTRLNYPMPYAKNIYDNYSARINPAFMLDCLKISEVENKPEPPWVKRNNSDLIFTDEIININIEFQTTEHDEQNQEEDQQYEGDEDGDEDMNESAGDMPESRQNQPFDPRRFRQQMRLDDDIERKLKKIMGDKN